ncbi:MAG TPA: hypothetical protein VE975_05920 [Actinomycetota bacterium]|jgi:hypothetical protein|nr:hypothetical protein [Actinomycetota bacterium]
MYERKALQLPGDLEERQVAAALGWTRVVAGAAMFLAPQKAARVWLGQGGTATVTRTAVRSLGGREAALGIGILLSLRNDVGVRGWLEGAAMADASDSIAMLTTYRRLPKVRRTVFIAAGVGAAVFQQRLAAGFA